jgi:phosphate starvation-inducible PhoH-like protein
MPLENQNTTLEFELQGIEPLNFFGPGTSRQERLQDVFPDLKLTLRGSRLVLEGHPSSLQKFQVLWEQLLKRCSLAKGFLSDDDFNEALLGREGSEMPGFTDHSGSKTILVHGPNGLVVRARTRNQQKMVDAMDRSDLLFALGPAGSGKTYTAVALAVRALKNKEIKKIILTRPAVEAGENLGFLPGDLKEKVDPYLRPLYDALEDMLPPQRLAKYLEDGIIEVAPLAFMRGRTLDKAFVILDEAQNCTFTQLKMFLTRMGPSARFIVTGDLTQIDLPVRIKSGLQPTLDFIGKLHGIAVVELDENDVVRHPLVKAIVHAYQTATNHHDTLVH